METNKKIALWMNYHEAEFISCESSNKILKHIASEHDKMPREDGQGATGTQFGNTSSNNEFKANHKEAGQNKHFFSLLEKELQPYDEILICGPTKAKDELKNLIAANKHFTNKTIHVESSDEITENQKLAFVRDYFGIKA